MDLNQILNSLSLVSEAIAIAIIVSALLLILLINRRRLLTRLREWQIQRCLDRIGGEQIRNLNCDDGLEGYYNIDRLALTDDAILLISYKPYGGNIYCAERISEWTQVIGQKSFKFENPLFELENQLTSLRLLIGNAPLRGYLFFNRSAVFPKGHPERVLTPDNIPESFLGTSFTSPNAETRAAWDALKAHQNGSRGAAEVGLKT